MRAVLACATVGLRRLGFACVLCLATSTAAASPRDRLVEVDVRDGDALARLMTLGLDVWSEHPRTGAVPVFTSHDERARLTVAGLPWRTLPVDVLARARAERERLAAVIPVAHGGGFFDDYRPLADIEAQLDTWAAADPTRVSVFEIGQSLEGASIRAIRISADDTPRPGVLVTAGQHAREWLSISSAMWLADAFITHADESPYVELLEQVELVIVPAANPDGYAYTWTDDRYWRKNRRDGIGVDTNRNFGVAWGMPGAGAMPTNPDYRGTAPFSEPETAAMRDWITAHPDPRVYVDLHTFDQLVLYPWGHQSAYPPDADRYEAESKQIVEAMTAVDDAHYVGFQAFQFYVTSGNSIDWAYGEAGVIAYNIELRPGQEATQPTGFSPGPDQIPVTGEEVVAAILVLAQAVADEVDDPTGTSSGGESTSGMADTTVGEATTSGSTSTGVATTEDSGAQSSSSGESSGGAAQEGGAGCGCTSTDSRETWSAAWIVLLAILRRRALTSR